MDKLLLVVGLVISLAVGVLAVLVFTFGGPRHIFSQRSIVDIILGRD